MAQDKLDQMIAKLTQREAEVLKLRCQGLEWPEVAKRLVVSERTVYFHVANIYEKLGLVELETRRKRDTALRQIFCPILQQLFREDGSPSRWAQKDDPNPKPPSEDTLALVMYDAMWPAVEAERAVVPLEQVVRQKASRGVEKLLRMPPKKSISLGILLGLLIGLMVSLIGGGIFLSTASLNLNPAAKPAPPTIVQPALVPPASIPIPTAAATRVVAQVVVTATTAPVTPTVALLPTAIPTLMPTATPVPNTNSGAVLQFGQEWYQDGVGVTLRQPLWQDRDVGVYCGGILSFRIAIANQTNTDLVVNVRSADWYAIDSRGNRYAIRLGVPNFGCGDWSSDLLPANKVTVPRPGWGTGEIFVVKGELQSLSNSQWLRVIIPKLSRTSNATWQIDVAH